MTTFQQMRDEVIALTKRPELISVTDIAIRIATLRAHQVDFFPRDVASHPLTYTVPTGNVLFVDIPALYTAVPLLRTPDFLQGLDNVTLLPNENLEYVPSYKDFWDEHNELRGSVFTLMGDVLKVRFAGATGRATLYYYKNPDVAEATYSSWIADTYKQDLAQWAAAIVWNRTGFQEVGQTTMQQQVVPFQSLLVESHLTRKI